MDLFPDNSQCCFRTQLAKPIHLNKQDWEVALVEMIVPNQVINVSEKEGEFFIVTYDNNIAVELAKLPNACELPNKKRGVRLCIPSGTYVTPQHLVETINDTIQVSLGDFMKKHHLRFLFHFSNIAKHVKMDTSVKLGIEFHPEMAIKLGIDPDYFQRLGRNPNEPNPVFLRDSMDQNPFPYTVDLYMGFNHLFVYSDLAAFTCLGNIEAPVLRVVPFDPKTKAGANPHIHYEFLNLHYVPLAKTDFDTIAIHIKGDTGKSIQFVNGKSMVKLHLRQRS